MPLDKDHLEYTSRRHGMDHDIYPWSNLFERKKVLWPGGKKVALWITISCEFFPLTPNDGPFRAPGHMVTPFPDLRSYTTKDYGNRVGIYRVLRVLDHLGLKASIPINARLGERYPSLLQEFTSRGWELIAHGLDMNHLHYGGMDPAAEEAQIADAVSLLGDLTGNEIAGWLSPARAQSENTLELLASQGIQYVCDWMNDDMPYLMKAGDKSIYAMPFSDELEDRKQLITLGHLENAYKEEVLTAYNLLKQEATMYGGRVLHIALTPYVIGQPFRIRILQEILQMITADDSVWSATGLEIFRSWQKQQS